MCVCLYTCIRYENGVFAGHPLLAERLGRGAFTRKAQRAARGGRGRLGGQPRKARGAPEAMHGLGGPRGVVFQGKSR